MNAQFRAKYRCACDPMGLATAEVRTCEGSRPPCRRMGFPRPEPAARHLHDELPWMRVISDSPSESMATQSVEESTLESSEGARGDAIQESIGLPGTSEVEVDIPTDISVGEGAPRSHIERGAMLSHVRDDLEDVDCAITVVRIHPCVRRQL
jgi:hypothetical protein